ncbi:MAG: hypothetical protein Q8P76_00200 [bacterium]|nr:hypothetical protein [bacterium]
MTLTTHAIVGAAAAQIFPSQPWLAFFAGFISHFIIDTIPHRDYSLSSLTESADDPLAADMAINKNSIKDFLKVGFDASLGIVLASFIFTNFYESTLLLAIIGAVGGIVPDGLQFAYWKMRIEPLKSLQRFHIWIQRHSPLNVPWLTSLSHQALIIAVILSLI